MNGKKDEAKNGEAKRLVSGAGASPNRKGTRDQQAMHPPPQPLRAPRQTLMTAVRTNQSTGPSLDRQPCAPYGMVL